MPARVFAEWLLCSEQIQGLVGADKPDDQTVSREVGAGVSTEHEANGDRFTGLDAVAALVSTRRLCLGIERPACTSIENRNLPPASAYS